MNSLKVYAALMLLVRSIIVDAIITKPDLSEYGVDVSYPIHHYLDGKGISTLALRLLSNLIISYCSFAFLQEAV